VTNPHPILDFRFWIGSFSRFALTAERVAPRTAAGPAAYRLMSKIETLENFRPYYTQA